MVFHLLPQALMSQILCTYYVHTMYCTYDSKALASTYIHYEACLRYDASSVLVR